MLTTDAFVLEKRIFEGAACVTLQEQAKGNLRSRCACGTVREAWRNTRSFKTEEKDWLREKWTNQNHGSSEPANHVSKPVNGGEIV